MVSGSKPIFLSNTENGVAGLDDVGDNLGTWAGGDGGMQQSQARDAEDETD